MHPLPSRAPADLSVRPTDRTRSPTTVRRNVHLTSDVGYGRQVGTVKSPTWALLTVSARLRAKRVLSSSMRTATFGRPPPFRLGSLRS